MPTGILKYKQDDGSIVELTPAGFVTQTTYNAGQAAQDGRLDALENAHHYANLEEALKDKGKGKYLDIVTVNAPFTFQPATAGSGYAEYEETASMRVQLPADSVIDDTTTFPTGNVTVTPQFHYLKDGKYVRTFTGYNWAIKMASYIPGIHVVELVLTPKEAVMPGMAADDKPVFWDYVATYL